MLLLLHGATDDPMEMQGIVNQWRKEYNVFLYAYDYHQRIQKIGRDLTREMEILKDRTGPEAGAAPRQLTILTYSYSACVLREAVLLSRNREPELFAGVSLIQLVPTAGGSSMAGLMRLPGAAWLTGLASPMSAVENPRGKIAIQLWDDEGNQNFCRVISPAHTRTIRVEGDPHSLAGFRNAGIHRRYLNGIGTNVVVIPKTAGASHEYFPSQPAALAYLRPLLERAPGQGLAVSAPGVSAP